LSKELINLLLNRCFSLKADVHQNFINTNFEALELIDESLFIGNKPKALGNKGEGVKR
jgi:hypothetical protein